jgi:hypothetical protein
MTSISWNMIEIYLKIFQTNMCTVIEFFSIFFLQFLAEGSYMPKHVTMERSYSNKTGTSSVYFLYLPKWKTTQHQKPLLSENSVYTWWF